MNEIARIEWALSTSNLHQWSHEAKGTPITILKEASKNYIHVLEKQLSPKELSERAINLILEEDKPLEISGTTTGRFSCKKPNYSNKFK